MRRTRTLLLIAVVTMCALGGAPDSAQGVESKEDADQAQTNPKPGSRSTIRVGKSLLTAPPREELSRRLLNFAVATAA